MSETLWADVVGGLFMALPWAVVALVALPHIYKD